MFFHFMASIISALVRAIAAFATAGRSVFANGSFYAIIVIAPTRAGFAFF
jgi:hypothetical protein